MGSPRLDWVRVGGIAGVASPVIFLVTILTLGFVHPSYSHLRNFISDLGALDAPFPWPQRLNFVQFGTGIVALGVGLWRAVDEPSRVVLGMLTLIGVGVFLSGVFPGHAADATSRESFMHGLVGLPAFLLIVALPSVAGRRFRHDDAWRDLSRLSYALTPLLALFLVLMGWSDGSPGGLPGLFQRLFIGSWMAWMVIVGMRLNTIAGNRSHLGA